jgi:hypothetical protein
MKTPSEMTPKMTPVDENKVEIVKHIQAATYHEELAKKHRRVARMLSKGDPEIEAEFVRLSHLHDVLVPVYDPASTDQHATP